MLIAEEFLLLCVDDESGKPDMWVVIDPALAGGVLIELALMKSIEVRPGKEPDLPELHVLEGSSTGDALLDDALRYLVEGGTTRVHDVVSAFATSPVSKDLRGRLLDRLVRAGVLGEERGKVLGIFPTTSWPTTNPEPEAEVRLRLRRALLEHETPTARTAALIGLLVATSHLPSVVSTDDASALEARAEAIIEGDWAAQAVKRAVDEFLVVFLLL